MFCIILRVTRISVLVLNIAIMDHFWQSQVSKNSLEKRVYRNIKMLFPWDYNMCPG